MATGQKEKKTKFKPVKHRLKFDLVSQPARTEGFVIKYIKGILEEKNLQGKEIWRIK